ncbi:sugar ABC transporter substrate-binding protein [Conexibacter stalactiti]|uniref:Sugar ABC transporter substrate-binding protein n=1 Tax=Conexibacter stalactiti TaxID=1940611 RepID=A0ABU4HY29_9ACTN|nr:sugar ABC transporter substrate-binding protein [Conexibacter stalactiti]MDW5598138.1 sugar ABC transporter substrate-binding protein [Conexibacter stalactiti]MEC5038780.1 sugar ABC transporter substrate-binding protein [Conexibacter stalactiti]
MRTSSWRGGLAVVASVGVAIALGACGSSSDDGGSGGGSGGDTPKVGYSTTSLGDAYRVVLARQVKLGGDAAGLDIQSPTDANNDPAKQITDVTTMLGQGVDGIEMIVLDSGAIKPALDRAEAKGVPVVAIDQGPSSGKVAMVVRGDNELMGRQACESIGAALDGRGKVLELQGALDGIGGQERTKGFNDCMKEQFPGIAVVSKPTDWLQEKATTAAQTVLSTDRDVNAVFLASDAAMLPGVLKVLERLGRLQPVGSDGHIPLVTIDGTPFGLEQVRRGYVDALVSQPLGGYARWAAHYVKAAIDGEEFRVGPTDHDSRIIEENGNLSDILPTPVVTRREVDDPELWGNQAAER